MTPDKYFSYRDDFSILQTIATKTNKPFIYLDSAASAQKPAAVIAAITQCYREAYANIHRGIYALSAQITAAYENARRSVQEFIGARSPNEIIFTHGTTDSINLIAHSYGLTHFTAGDEVILSEMEHHSNIVPWYLLKEKLGIVLKIIPMTDEGALDLSAYQALFTKRTKLVTVTHASNVLGTINPIQAMAEIAHTKHVPILVDGAQAIAHLPVNVQDLDCDFYVFSAHKLYGPTGTGVLFGKQALLATLPPHHSGGGMIETVSFEKVTFQAAPQRFEAGTPNIVGVLGLAAAIQYLQNIGMNRVFAHDQHLIRFTDAALQQIPQIKLIGTTWPRVGVQSFVMQDMHPHDIGTILDHEGIAVRAGHHCAMPLMRRLGVPSTVRISFGVYNDEEDIIALTSALKLAKKILLRA